MVKAIPDIYPRLMPYLIVDGAADAITFYEDIFGATERMRMPNPDGRLGHAELQIGDTVLMLADEDVAGGYRGPRTIGGTPVGLMVYVEDVNDVVERAVAAGAKVTREVRDEFYGDRSGSIEDPFGHLWHVATHIEDVSDEEMARRAAEAAGA